MLLSEEIEPQKELLR